MYAPITAANIENLSKKKSNVRLRKISTYSKRSYKRYVPVRRRNWSRKATTVANTELDEKYENAWHSVAKPPRRRSGIIREISLSMRVLSVVPRYAVTVGSLKARRVGTVIGKTREERGHSI